MADDEVRPFITVAGVDYEITGSSVSLTLAEELCRRYADGEALKDIVRDIPGCPGINAIRQAAKNNDWFGALWAQATLDRADHFSDEIQAIADDTSNDMYEAVTRDGGTYMAPNMAAVARAKLRIEARKAGMRHLNPRKYAEKALALEEGIGGLVITWADGQAIGRVPRKLAQDAERAAQSKAVPAIIEGEYVDVSAEVEAKEAVSGDTGRD